MFSLFQNLNSNYYYISIILQAICVYHVWRNGTHQRWMYLIIFLPVVGCLIYLFTEILTKRNVSSIHSDVSNIVNPGAKVKELEKRFQFSDTLSNRIALAEAYMQKGLSDKVIELAEPALTGLFENNEHLVNLLIRAYFAAGRYNDVVRIAPRISKTINFYKSKQALLFAQSLEHTGKVEQAEREYKSLNHRFSNYEARYNYAKFLIAQNREEDANAILTAIVNEASNISRKEMGESKVWINKATKELESLSV